MRQKEDEDKEAELQVRMAGALVAAGWETPSVRPPRACSNPVGWRTAPFPASSDGAASHAPAPRARDVIGERVFDKRVFDERVFDERVFAASAEEQAAARDRPAAGLHRAEEAQGRAGH